ncbi:TOPRS ligase, partial [Podilymbus podiceps]|nr:TOPRS ligase [Podilymbus podiceps]
MAAESEWSCPVCCDDQDDVAYLSPCLHKFCLGCALRWARQKPNCPLCRARTTTVVFSVWADDNYLTFDVPGPAEPPAEDQRDEPGLVPGTEVDSFPTEVWADFFKSHPDNIRPLLPWLRRQLEELAEGEWWEVAAAEGTVVAHLCLHGLDEAVLAQQLRACLPEDAGTFTRQLIAAAVRLCRGGIRRHLGWQDSSPAASPGPGSSRERTPDPHPGPAGSPAGSTGEEEGSRPEATPRGVPRPPPPAPGPAEQEQPQEEPGEAAAAGPSAQGCSRSPSTPSRDRDRPPGGPRRAPKRRAPSPQDSPQPHKRPPCQRH